MGTTLTTSTDIIEALNYAFIEPARNLTKSRGKNIHRYSSVKMGKRVSVETTLEYDACFHFDFTKKIKRFCSQPVRYSYSLNGEKHTYVPDFLVEFESGEFILYEVKTNEASESKLFEVEFEAKKLAAEQLGIYLELITQSQIREAHLLNNFKLLHRYASRKDLTIIQKIVLGILEEYGTVSIDLLIYQTGFSKQKLMPALCNLLSKCILDADLYLPITSATEVELTYA